MKIENRVYLRAVASFRPPRVHTSHAVEAGWYQAADLDLFGLTGTLVAGDTSPAEMATAAATTALARAGLTAAELDYVIHSSVFQPGPDGWSLPGHVLRRLGGGTASVIELRSGCSGMLGALELAVAQLTGAQAYSSVLLTAADNFGPWLERWQPDVFIPGDAGSAIVLGSTGGFARVVAVNSASLPELEEMQRGDEPLHPPGARGPIDLPSRHAAFGERVMSQVDAARLMAKVHVELAERSAAEAGIAMTDVRRLIYHNMAGFILDQLFLGPLGLSMAQSSWEFGRTVGHLGASDQAVSLEHLLLSGALAPGDHVMLCGAAAGFTSSCVLIEILEVPTWSDAGAG